MSVELFLFLLFSSIVITIFLTGFIKRLLVLSGTPHRDNIVAGIASLTASTGVGVIYRIPFGLGFNPIQLLRLFLLIAFTWVMSMVVYDKVVQTIEQHKKYKKEKESV